MQLMTNLDNLELMKRGHSEWIRNGFSMAFSPPFKAEDSPSLNPIHSTNPSPDLQHASYLTILISN